MNDVNTHKILKNGHKLRIREAKPDDGFRLLQCINAYLPDSEFIPMDAEELAYTSDTIIHWIEKMHQQNNSILLLAEVEGTIVGNLDLTGSTRKMMSHTAILGMGLLKSWRGLGIGSQLLNVAIQWAEENDHLELIWLQVFAQNQTALNLYKNAGFKQNGHISNFFKGNSNYDDNIFMSRSVKSSR
ncbi:MAG TPA: GNAT family N-acetyltransferase [Saprospiraceae bacterium]|nr:GNAT family N-acetyltransferase [Saprospiraceae bacterium]MCB0699951.1 GNAT family N-acetyltransferase [Chitinophagaceae bacterium]MCB9327177.1 GNAT family N-acetyltransferase [Lewinellaceae bacterium]HPK10502.1 GNAT family N-acetyltransferase [Saprospiraceae bacterium]HRX28345.1 GNAT family N-acetyltransferase [Saprospiraceae bacterium]